MPIAPDRLAEAIDSAYRERRTIPPPSSVDAAFDLSAGYAAEQEQVRLRARSGHRPVGRKVGYANKAAWRVLDLETLAWAHMYDDTVLFAAGGVAALPIQRMLSPKIEPEIVFRLRQPLPGDVGGADPAAVLAATEWLALGFEIIDCVFPDWKFQPADFIAASGLHAALVVGEPRPVVPGQIAALVDQLPRFKVRLMKNGEPVDEGSGRNSLRSPALCVAELAAGIARRPGSEPLAAGELISSGTLTSSWPVTPGDTWSAAVEGLDLDPLLLRFT